MSVFDLFRGFFGVPGGQYRGDGRRDPFFDGMTHDDDDDDDDDAYQEDGFPQDGYCGDQREPFDNALRFGFSFGPNGMRIDEPPLFGHVLRGMEEIFSHLSRFEEQHGTGPFGKYLHGSDNNGQRSSSGNALRDSMLKSQEDAIHRHRAPAVPPRDEDTPSLPSSPFHGWSPFPKVRNQTMCIVTVEVSLCLDLDSAVSSGGLDKILTPRPSETPSQPRSRSYFQSVIVSKVVKPDGSVEERRTVRDGQGNEETTVTRTSVKCALLVFNPTSGGGQLFSDLRDDGSMFPRFFGGFK
uniref:HCLS1 associated protein X-1 n=1 Tax=Gadus morhua TaxID=8049 RepID=A0A8C5F724_GADMO